MSQPYEAIVVGAGPAGSAAAIALAGAGRQVLLLDRHAFPRDKPCGDLIGARAMKTALRLGVDPNELKHYQVLSGATLLTDGGGLNLVPGSPIGRRLLAGSDARVVPRFVFDRLLVERAIVLGAEFRKGAVRDIGPWEGDGRVVSVDNGTGTGTLDTVRASTVIVAGGYGCRVAADVASLAKNDGPARGIAMRGYFRDVRRPVDRVVFALNRWLLPGYGWIFPLPNGMANVGVGRLVRGDDEESVALQEMWRRFTMDEASPVADCLRDAVPTGAPRSWPLDLGPRRRCLVADGLLVAGEAAGLVGPLTGAGIAFALESGSLAGETLAAALADGRPTKELLSPYGRKIRRRTAPWLRAELLAQRFLSDPTRVDHLFDTLRPLPPTGTIGARMLLHHG